MRSENRLVALGLLVALLGFGCGPVSSSTNEPPPLLAVEPGALDFSVEESSQFLQISNKGGGDLSYTLQVSATTEGLTWLVAEPLAGTVGSGSSRSVSLSLVAPELLSPGVYSGQVTVEAAEQESEIVDVTLTVGQPILAVDPGDSIDFGSTSDTRTVIVRNAGKGKLRYALHLPGKWITQTPELPLDLGPEESQTIELAVDRSIVPWYGDDRDELVVSSNGQDSAPYSGSATLEVVVNVDDSCAQHADCAKAGYYCLVEGVSGTCTQKKANGASCAGIAECASGYCVDGLCCDGPCSGTCSSCNLAGLAGTCSTVADETPCDDGLVCTENDSCVSGECTGGGEPDCSEFDTACVSAVCVEEEGGCVAPLPEDQCSIEGTCYEAGTTKEGSDCMACDPESNVTDWTLSSGYCEFGGACYADGEAIGGACQLCDADKPYVLTPAPDNTPCMEDTNPCTEGLCQSGECNVVNATDKLCNDGNLCTQFDQCSGGMCAGTPYSCDDSLSCTTDSCDGVGGCGHELLPDYCILDEACVLAGDSKEGTHGCSLCDPSASTGLWSKLPNNTDCNDGDLCTEGDACQLGVCGGSPVDCDDGLSCTVDSCDPENGQCVHDREPNYCIIDSTCILENLAPSEGPNKDCLVCIPYKNAMGWSAHNDGSSCDDQSNCSLASTCSNGSCLSNGPLCDDNNECTADNCTDQNTCNHIAVANGTDCESDDLECTEDTCQNGECDHAIEGGFCLIAGTCITQNETHPDNPCLGCVPYTQNLDWSPTNEGMPCQDDLWCTVDESCATGVCSGVPRECGGGDCTDQWCLESEEECVVAPKLNGVGCDDEDACTLDDSCLAGECVGNPKDCSGIVEGNPCFDGICVPNHPEEPGKCVPQQRSQGSVCDDELACTADTTCTAAGVCEGSTVTSSTCAELLELDSQCLEAVCEEPEGCGTQPILDGTPCDFPNAIAQCDNGVCTFIQCSEEIFADCNDDLSDGCEAELSISLLHCGECNSNCIFDHAWTECSAGQCNLVACKEGYTNCDDDPANGCESATATDPANCGECGSICYSANPAKLGVCEAGECQLVACEGDFWNLDGDPTNGCECIEGGEELCNNTDDDCDGEVDEGFDLGSDMENCGACGVVCQIEGVAGFDCFNGQCLITACPDGLIDANGLTDDGCEFEQFAVADLWVDSLNGGLPGADGSQAQPFDEIQDALAIAEPSTRIHVMAGTYLGPVLIDQVGIVLVGEDKTQVTIAGTEGYPAVTITSNEVVVRELTIAGGSEGIRVEGTPLDYVDTTLLVDLNIQNQTAPAAADEQSDLDAAGVHAAYVEGLVLQNVLVNVVTGGTMFEQFDGGWSAGLHCHWCTNPMVLHSTFENLQGGDAGDSPADDASSGGWATGIRLVFSTGGSISGNTFRQISGGPGGFNGGGGGGLGGVASAFHFSQTTGMNIHGNSIADLTGGEGGDGGYQTNGPAPDQVAFGLYFEDDSVDNQVALNNYYAEQPIVFLSGQSDTVVEGLDLSAGVNPTNHGIVVVYDCENITLRNLNASGFQGQAGETYQQSFSSRGETGYPGFGFRLVRCNNCTVENSAITDVLGGTGGKGGSYVSGGHGGGATGLLMEDCTGCTATGNRIGSIAGGRGYVGGYGKDWAEWHKGASGFASGVHIANCQSIQFRNNRVHDVRRSWGDAAATVLTACMTIDGDIAAAIRHLSCYGVGVGDYPNEGDGVRLYSSATATIQVVNSIFSTIGGYGVHGLEFNEGLLSASYSTFHDCPLGDSLYATVGVGCIQDDPLFHNPDEGNLTLLPESPAIDAGLPTTDCNEEPVPNGCRVNMGAYGGTSEATPATGAVTCGVCPPM